MSTVQDLLDDLQYWIPEEEQRAGIFGLFNSALSMIAKRLYFLNSELITGTMSIQAFKEVILTGSDIAFTAGIPGGADPTITQSGARFVTAGYKTGMSVKTNNSDNPGPFHIRSVAAGTLTLDAGDVVTAVSAGSSTTLTSDNSFAYLPDDFWGMKDEPYIVGKTYPLDPLPNKSVEIQFTSAADSIYYKIRGNKFCLVPVTGSDITISGDYFQKLTKLTSLTDTLPFNELFDDIIPFLVVKLFRGGPVIDLAIRAAINDSIDSVALKREKKGATQMPRGVDYDLYAQ